MGRWDPSGLESKLVSWVKGLFSGDSNQNNSNSSNSNSSNSSSNTTQTAKQKVVVFAQVNLYDNANDFFYNLLVTWKCKKIKRAAEKAGFEFVPCFGTDGSVSEFLRYQEDSTVARIIVIGHGWEGTGMLSDENDNEFIIDTNKCVVPVIDMVGCYARKNSNYRNFTNQYGSNVIVNTYNDQYVDSFGFIHEDEIWWNQTNKVLNDIIPNSIKSGNPNSGGVPTIKKDSFTYWLRGLL